MRADRFAAERLACPLGIPVFEWMRHGGQRIFLLAEERMAVVVTAGMYDEQGQAEAPRRLLEAVLEAAR